MSASSPRFVDRQIELDELRALSARPGPALALLYGRRRVGKTYLLDEAWADAERFYYLATDSTPARNRMELIRELAGWTGRDHQPEDFPTWRTVFRHLAGLTGERPLVVVLDEFPYLMGDEDDDVVSQLAAVWDREVRDRDLTLVLCGSTVGTMERLRSGDSALYGRIDWMARLRPFDYLDTARMVADRPAREAARVYGIFGGTPRYLSAIRPGEPLGSEVSRTVLSPRGEVHLQLAHLLEQEQGIRRTGEYRAVLAAVAEGNTGTNEIAGAAGLQGSPHVARRALETLEELELVRRERLFDAGPRSPWRNRIAEPAVEFWHRFVEPSRARLETGGDPKGVWEDSVAPHLSTYMGRIFERMCRQAYVRHYEDWGLPGADEWARWEGQDRNGRDIEVDVVARLADGRLLAGEIKWSSRPVDVRLHHGLTRDLEDLANSGRGWARRARDPETSAGRIYFSAAGFTDRFRSTVDDEETASRLLDLQDLYQNRHR
ncbi:MAG: ATP-binding protein [Gemmatimonadota bacterium]